MAFMDSGVMVSSDDFFKVSSCIDSVITGGGSAREWIVSDWKLVSSDLCFAQIKVSIHRPRIDNNHVHTATTDKLCQRRIYVLRS